VRHTGRPVVSEVAFHLDNTFYADAIGDLTPEREP